MYNIFCIYTYKYTRPSNTLTLSHSHALNAHTSQDYIKQPDKLYSPTSTKRKPFIYGQKCTSRIMHQSYIAG